MPVLARNAVRRVSPGGSIMAVMLLGVKPFTRLVAWKAQAPCAGPSSTSTAVVQVNGPMFAIRSGGAPKQRRAAFSSK